jgi:hypothetical protein
MEKYIPLKHLLTSVAVGGITCQKIAHLVVTIMRTSIFRMHFEHGFDFKSMSMEHSTDKDQVFPCAFLTKHYSTKAYGGVDV